METPDILVIGGGIIGCSLARELARAGDRVVILERGSAGCEASSAAAGLLAPTLGTIPLAPLAELCFQSAALYESWIAELIEDGARDVGFCRPGVAVAWLDPAEAASVRQNLSWFNRPGRRAEWLTDAALRRQEPALRAEIAGALLYPDDAQVTSARLVQQLARVTERAGVPIRENEPVLQMVRVGDRITAVQTATTRYQPGSVVLTAGAWSGDVLSSAGVCLPTRPVKGQLLLAECRVSPVRQPLEVGQALFVPRPDGGLVVGVTVEEAGYDRRVTLEGLHTILDRACAAVPAVRPLPLRRAWAGLRPATPDDLPYMGPVPPLRNLWVSTGHFRKGILLAPLCARRMAWSIRANRLDAKLEPFAPARVLNRG